MESIESGIKEADPEDLAWDELEAIFGDPKNKFINEHPSNKERIDNAPTAFEKLQIAKELIKQKLDASYRFHVSEGLEGVELGSINHEGIKTTIDSIWRNREMIGEGGDAHVVIDKNEIIDLPPEICYKFAKNKELEGGQNTILEEVEMQGDFYREVIDLSSFNIGVPKPLYSAEYGDMQLIGMEKLDAKSIKKISEGEGCVPDWFDIDSFCDQLKRLVGELHSKGLYHRDLHVGNVMISQSEEPPEDGMWGYIIDFGYSGHVYFDEDPYVTEVSGKTFTHKKDDAIMVGLSESLHNYRNKLQGV